MGKVTAICSWCGKLLGAVEGDFDVRYQVTHGICDACSRDLVGDLGLQGFQDFLDGFSIPVLLVDADARVLSANTQARSVLGRSLPQVVGFKAGDVFGCLNARTPGGCCKTTQCRTCIIRASVVRTFLTGEPCLGVVAYPEVLQAPEAKALNLRIATEKIGACVLLRIDDLGAQT